MMKLAPSNSSVRACDLPLLRPPRYDWRKARQGNRIPTVLECRPHRPRPRPRWSPSSPNRSFLLPTGCVEPVKVRLWAAPDLGHTRINFNYRNVFETSASLDDKSARQQYCEGANEIFWRRWFVVNVNVTDFQFQPIKIVFIDEHGRERTAYWDVGIELVDGSILFGEIKANHAFFEVPETRIVVEGSAAALAPENIGFARLMGTDFDEITKRTIKDVFDGRLTSYSEREVIATIAVIASEGGAVKLAHAVDVIAGHRHEARAKLCSMMTDRRIAIDLDLPLIDDHTMVRLPPKARNPGALRAFLARFAG